MRVNFDALQGGMAPPMMPMGIPPALLARPGMPMPPAAAFGMPGLGLPGAPPMLPGMMANPLSVQVRQPALTARAAAPMSVLA